MQLVLQSLCSFPQINTFLHPLWPYGPLAVPHAVGLHHEGNKEEHAVVEKGKYEIENELCGRHVLKNNFYIRNSLVLKRESYLFLYGLHRLQSCTI